MHLRHDVGVLLAGFRAVRRGDAPQGQQRQQAEADEQHAQAGFQPLQGLAAGRADTAPFDRQPVDTDHGVQVGHQQQRQVDPDHAEIAHARAGLPRVDGFGLQDHGPQVQWHEKEDGKGYPMGLVSEDIPLFSKIIAIADIFDAMTSNRVYRKKELPFIVLEMFLNSSFGKLDTKLVMLFVTKFSEYYLGTKVILNTGETAMILKFNEYELTKPLIRTDSGIFIDTSINREVKMVDFQLI